MYVFMLFVGGWLIAGTMLHRAGVKSVFITRGFKRTNAATGILLGATMVLSSIAGMIPKRESTYVLLGCLYLVALGVAIAALVAWLREKPV